MYIFASKSNADCFGNGVGNTHKIKDSIFLIEHCTDRNQITHLHFTIFAPISPGHFYFHSILRSRMKQNNMIAVNQVMPSSCVCQYQSDDPLRPIWSKHLVASEYVCQI